MKKKMEGTWQGEYVLERGYSRLLIPKKVAFLFHVIYNDAHGGFEALIEDDPEFYRKEVKAKAYGVFSDNQIRFVKITDQTYILPLPDLVSKLHMSDENFEIRYKGHLNNDSSIVGFWEADSIYRRVDDRIVELGPVEGSWRMKKLG